MSTSYTTTITTTFTATHARYMAAKVAADLKRLQRLYGEPSDAWIKLFEEEIIEFLKAGVLGTVTYGFYRDRKWIEPTLRYTAHDLEGDTGNDDDPGRIRPWANIDSASFHSYLTYNLSWYTMSSADREAFDRKRPFQRSGAPEPAIDGYLSDDRTYSSGGRALNRASVRSSR